MKCIEARPVDQTLIRCRWRSYADPFRASVHRPVRPARAKELNSTTVSAETRGIGSERLTTMLEAKGLTKFYGSQKALDALDLSVEPGHVFCLLGANGAGKTTTINLFLNFIEANSGQAFINGLDVAQKPLETKKHLACIPEQVMLYRNLTGLENLEYFTALASHEEYSKDQLRSFLVEAGLPAEAVGRRVSG